MILCTPFFPSRKTGKLVNEKLVIVFSFMSEFVMKYENERKYLLLICDIVFWYNENGQ